MLVLKILIGLALLAVVPGALFAVNRNCMEKFNVSLISKDKIIGLFISSLFILVGATVYSNARQSGGDVLNGILLAAIGALIIIGMIAYLYINTNILYGTLGMVINLALLALVTVVGWPLLIVYFILSVIVVSSAKSVYVVNK